MVTCKEVLEDLIKNGSNKKNLVLHMKTTLEWGSSIFWVLTWRILSFFPPFSALPVSAYWLSLSQLPSWLEIVGEILLHADDHIHRLKGYCFVYIYIFLEVRKPFSYVPPPDFSYLIGWYQCGTLVPENGHWQEQYSWFGIKLYPSGQGGAQHLLKHLLPLNWRKLWVFLAREKGRNGCRIGG